MMRVVVAILCLSALGACGVSSGHEAAGRYSSTWEPREELILKPSGEFEHRHGGGTATVGSWVLLTDGVDTRIQMQAVGQGGVSVPSIERNLFGRVHINVNIDEGRYFWKEE